MAGAYLVFLALSCCLRGDHRVEARAHRARARRAQRSWPRSASDERQPARAGRLAQDGAGGAARAPRAAGGPRGRACWASSWRTTRSTRPWPSPPATAPSSTSWPATTWRPRARRSACSRARPTSGPTELFGHLYSLRGSEAVRHLFERHRRARLDDRRRGRGAGPGQARVRARARGGRRPGRSPTACSATRSPPASACAPRPAIGRSRVVGVLGGRRAGRGARSATSSAARVLVIGAGENGELTAQALQRARRATRCSWPTAATTARSGWPSASAAWRCASTTCPAELARRRHRRLLHRLAAPDRRTATSSRGSWSSAPGGRCS